MTKTKLIRKSVQLTKQVDDWIKEEADSRGITQTALINNIIHEYSRQDDALKKLTQLLKQQESTK